MKNNIVTKELTFHRLLVSTTLLVLTLCSSCEHKNKSAYQYFNIDSLVQKQVASLVVNKPSLLKETFMEKGGGAERRTDTISQSSLNESFLLKELDVFLQLQDMNKPVNQGKYKVEDGLQDTQSNLKVKLFTGTPDQKVRWLKIYYHDAPSKLKKLEAQFDEENMLYKNSRNLTMEFQEIHNKTLLTSYSVIGGQKMFMADSVRFGVVGKLKIH